MLSTSFDKAVEHHRAGELDKAVALYRHVLKTSKGNEAARVGQMLGSALQQLGHWEAAEEAVRAAIRAEAPPAFRGRRALAMLLAARGRLNDAVRVWEDAVEAARPIAPEAVAEARLHLATQLSEARRIDDAFKIVRELVEQMPKVAPMQYELGRLAERMGRLAEARAALDKTLELTPGVVEAQILLSRIDLAEGKAAAARARLETAMLNASDELRGVLLIELARVLDKQGDYAQAFDAATKGQQINFAVLPPQSRDGRPHEWVMDHCLEITAEEVAEWNKPADQPGSIGKPPIFVIGFPRSGTTLVEQMLGAHPNLVVSDETPLIQRVRERLYMRFRPKGEYPKDLGQFTPEQLGQARRWYFELAENALGAGGVRDKRIVDKQPLNTVDAAFIRLLFPESPVVYIARDARDTVLSCFMQGFARGVPHLFTLEGTAHLYGRFGRIWEHYKQVLGLKYLEVRYEELVNRPEEQARRLVEFIGEPWNDAVLKFHEEKHRRYVSTPSYADVAKPIHNAAVGRWKKYETQLAPVIAAVGKSG